MVAATGLKITTVGETLHKYDSFLRPDFDASKAGKKAIERLGGFEAAHGRPIATLARLEAGAIAVDHANKMRMALLELKRRDLPESTPILDSLWEEVSRCAHGAIIEKSRLRSSKGIVDDLLLSAKVT